MAAPDVLNAQELADKLGVDGRRLRLLIRKHNLAPTHLRGERYAFDAREQARIARDPHVSRLIADSRR